VYGAPNINYPFAQQGVGATQFAWTRNALGNISVNGPGTAAAGTLNAWAALADFKRPAGLTFPFTPVLQGTFPTSNEFGEVFGTAAGGPGQPFSGGATTGQFEVAPWPWGMAVIDIFAIYSVVTTALTSATLGLTRTTYGADNTALSVTSPVAATGVALTVTAAANNPHFQKISLTQPLLWEISDQSDLTIEFVAVTGATINSLQLFALGAHVAMRF
jgi:hypothetical protein